MSTTINPPPGVYDLNSDQNPGATEQFAVTQAGNGLYSFSDPGIWMEAEEIEIEGTGPVYQIPGAHLGFYADIPMRYTKIVGSGPDESGMAPLET